MQHRNAWRRYNGRGRLPPLNPDTFNRVVVPKQSSLRTPGAPSSGRRATIASTAPGAQFAGKDRHRDRNREDTGFAPVVVTRRVPRVRDPTLWWRNTDAHGITYAHCSRCNSYLALPLLQQVGRATLLCQPCNTRTAAERASGIFRFSLDY